MNTPVKYFVKSLNVYVLRGILRNYSGPSSRTCLLNYHKPLFTIEHRQTVLPCQCLEQYTQVRQFETAVGEDVCYNCKQPGHFKHECPDIVCLRCGEKGHITRYCSQEDKRSYSCTICGQQGHTKMKCPELTCNTCGQKGHAFFDCPETVCHSCGKKGHSLQSCPERVCYRCGESGHTSRFCPQPYTQTLKYQPKDQ